MLTNRFQPRLFVLVMIALLFTNQGWSAEETAGEMIGSLVVFVNGGCTYCRRFHSEVGVFYDKTRIGQKLPLKEVDLDLPDEPYETLAKSVRFVPTFILLDRQGREQGRFRGYRTDEFFWAELEKMARRLECSEKLAARLPC